MSRPIYPGAPVKLTFHVYNDADALADPSSMPIHVRGPCGARVDYTLSDCTHVSTGVYTLIHRTSFTDSLGVWWSDAIPTDSLGVKLGVLAGTFALQRDGTCPSRP